MTQPPPGLIEHQMRFREILARLADDEAAAQAEAPTPGPFVTISRQAGSGGGEVARRLGRALEWSVLDRELVDGLARRLEVEPHFLGLVDETRSNWFTDTLLNLMNSRLVLQDSFVQILGRVVVLAAFEGRTVIVGRGGNLLAPADGGLRVRLVAPRQWRVDRVAREEGTESARIADLVDEIDRSRTEFIRRHFRVEPDSCEAYDLVLDSSRFGIDGCVSLILQALDTVGIPRPA